MKVLEALAAAIAAEGIDHLFAVMGDANQDVIVELCEKHGLKFVHAHHEGSAVGMADGYSRFSGKIGLADAWRRPWLYQRNDFLGLRPTASIASVDVGRPRLIARPLQSAGNGQSDLAKVTAEATVKVDHANNIDYCIGEAFRQLKAKKGPFVLNMPQDIQHSMVPDEKWTYRPVYKTDVLQPPRPVDVAEAAEFLANAKRPAILCGLGAANAKAEPEVRELAEYLGAPLATTLLAAGFCAQYPLYLGIRPDVWAQT